MVISSKTYIRRYLWLLYPGPDPIANADPDPGGRNQFGPGSGILDAEYGICKDDITTWLLSIKNM
jgi:hypothetical protein